MKKLFVLLLFALGFITGKAQAHLGIGGAGRMIYNYHSIVHLTDSGSYYVWIKNKDSASFSGTIIIHTAVDTMNTFHQIRLDTLSLLLSGGDSTPVTLTETNYSPPNYRVGGNIVVIWPSAQNAITVDSTAYTPLYILGPSSVFAIQDDRSLKIFPNPCEENITVQETGTIRISLLKLFDAAGSLLKEFKNTNTISLAEYPAGMYFVQAEFADRTSRTYKIIRRE